MTTSVALSMTWQDKAKEIMGRYAYQAYLQANRLPNGKMRKRHVPYNTPEICQALAKALDEDDEHEAKRLFLVESAGSWSLI